MEGAHPRSHVERETVRTSTRTRMLPPHLHLCPASILYQLCRKAERRASRDRVTARVIIRPPRERVRNDYGGRGASRHPPTHVVS